MKLDVGASSWRSPARKPKCSTATSGDMLTTGRPRCSPIAEAISLMVTASSSNACSLDPAGVFSRASRNRCAESFVCAADHRFRKPLVGCIHHSDRGSQYCAHEYQADVKTAGLIASMSRKGNCYDNAPTESFWGSLKQELVYHYHFKTRAEAQAAIQEHIAIFYNRMRRHSSIGCMAPSIYAESFSLEKKSA